MTAMGPVQTDPTLFYLPSMTQQQGIQGKPSTAFSAGSLASLVRRGGGEEIPLVQGKEQWLRFAGAAMKRYPTPKVRETQVRR